MIELRNIKKKFGSLSVLNGICATIETGEIISLTGPSGAGKTTLLRCIAGLHEEDSGEILIDGKSVRDTKKHHVSRDVGMVFQQFNLFPHLTALENITLAPVHILKQKKEDAETHAAEFLESVGLADKALSLPEELSGGQQQRVAIARTLAMNPKLMLFDEPTSALDPETSAALAEILKKLAKNGITLIIVSHDMAFVKKVSDRIFRLENGVISKIMTPADMSD